MWLATTMKAELQIEVGPVEIPIDLCWASGMIGALPVFSTKQEAVDYTGSDKLVLEINETGDTVSEQL